MNGRFKFRAKRIDNNEFIYGFLCFIFRDVCRIYCSQEDKFYDCATKTLGQCTGLKDKNGRLIYEGDILENNVLKSPVEWFNGGFWINGFTNGVKWNIHFVHDTSTVVGNIHENPELLEVKK